VLEAGGDPMSDAPEDSGEGGLNSSDVYQVPLFHALAAENPAMAWSFFVRHYSNDAQQRRDPKFTGHRGEGILYPRAGALGGCTANHAMITLCPPNWAWDWMAAMVGDRSWAGDRMRPYFERMEDCRHRPFYRWLARKFGWNFTRHGWGGWLTTETSIPDEMRGPESAVAMITGAAVQELVGDEQRSMSSWAKQGQLDPNDWRLVRENAFGLCYLPMSTRQHARIGTRERLLSVAARHPDRLRVELDALATRVLFDDEHRAVGVEYLKGRHLYRAHARPGAESGEQQRAVASREVILAGGVFNTPQLLMLSGVGPSPSLTQHGIPVRVDLPGVGRNLQDCYQVSVVLRMKKEWQMLRGVRFDRGDPEYTEWTDRRSGICTSNGVVLGIAKRSDPANPLPDLLTLACLGQRQGYFPGYSSIVTSSNYLSWIVLKAHNNNRSGQVRLRSPDPRDPPSIDFHYFEEGTDAKGEDLQSIVDGIQFVRAMTTRYRHLVEDEEKPGAAFRTNEDLRQYVRDSAWGDQAFGSCPMGPRRDPDAVVDSRFRVRGVDRLRIVDASVFPSSPGFFIFGAVCMIGEKAADVILEDGQGMERSARAER
jgi:choline dehydrogenase-like flavoprotein